jgi:thioesterase domain-containing protein/acyl carrier protein
MHQAIVAQAAAHRDVLDRHQLRFIRSSSAAMPARVLAELERIFGVPLIEAYGMTEGAHQLASNPLPPRPRKAGSVGVAAGPEIAVMAGESLAPAGVVGEIVVRGRNVTGGYRDNPAANAAAFTHGWFRTGDQGYLDPDGYVFITGRIKEIINRGGQKIAPLEVEEVLLDHPAVAQAAVFPMAHASLGEAVAAAVVFRPGTTATESEIQEFVLGRLAEYKVPSRVVGVSALPKGPTGKLQRTTMAAQLAAELQSDHVAPGTRAERELAALWADVLGVERVGIHDNFFSLGGDSLRAGQLFARIARVFGTKLPPATLLRAATVEQLARLLHEPAMAHSSLVLVQAGGPKPPFYYVHGPGGDVLHLRKLAILLGRDQPCYGLQARGLYGTEPPHRRIEDMAAHYVAEIRAHQPRGPYFIGGFCFGGQIAYEMARQLHAQGEEVALVAMIDSYVRRSSDSSRAPVPRSHAVRRAARRLRFHAATLRRLDRAARWRYLATRVTNARTKLHIGLWRALDRVFARTGLPRPTTLELRDLTLIHYEAGRSYAPPPYAGAVALFVTQESSEPATNDPRLAWKKLAAGGARVYTIAGTHDTILEDAQLRQLAQHLKQALEDAQARAAVRQSTGNPES